MILSVKSDAPLSIVDADRSSKSVTTSDDTDIIICFGSLSVEQFICIKVEIKFYCFFVHIPWFAGIIIARESRRMSRPEVLVHCRH